MPEQLAVLGRHADYALLQKLDVLALAVHVGGDDRGIMGRAAFGRFIFPDRLTGFFVERDQSGVTGAGSGNDLVAIHERRFAIAPRGDRAAEITNQVLMPALLTGGGFQANQVAIFSESVEYVPIHGGCAARSFGAIGARRSL